MERDTTAGPVPRYLAPRWFDRNVANRFMRRLTRMGLPIRRSAELEVRGRTSGAWRSTVVNPLRIGAAEYLVAPRGATQWARNLRAAGGGRLRVGRRVDEFTAVEVADADKADILRRYLAAWRTEVGRFFEGVGPDAPDADLAAIAPGYPVFRIERVAAGR